MHKPIDKTEARSATFVWERNWLPYTNPLHFAIPFHLSWFYYRPQLCRLCVMEKKNVQNQYERFVRKILIAHYAVYSTGSNRHIEKGDAKCTRAHLASPFLICLCDSRIETDSDRQIYHWCMIAGWANSRSSVRMKGTNASKSTAR